MKKVVVKVDSGVIGYAHINPFSSNIVYDFVEQAPSATWMVGNATDKGSFLVVPFSGTTSDDRGYACYQLNTKLSDGITYSKLLETHPRGLITAVFQARTTMSACQPAQSLN
jgi:hypothetical protein